MNKNIFPVFFLACILALPNNGAGESDSTDVSGTDISGVVTNGRPSPKRAARRAKKNKKKVVQCQTKTPLKYKKMVQRWMRAPPIAGPRYRHGYRDLVLYSVNHRERIRIFPFQEDGELSPEALNKIRQLFRDRQSGTENEIDPRLVKLLYKLADHFKVRQITIISGFRKGDTAGTESRHSRGKAVDFVLPGIPLIELARRARTLGHVGVGFYPNSGFVHLDIRRKRSVFWMDRSAPGKRSCYRRLLKKTAINFDRRWRERHDEPRRRPAKEPKKRPRPEGKKTRQQTETPSVSQKPAPDAGV